MGTQLEDVDQSLTSTDPATARAMIEAAIDSGSQLYPPLTSGNWPMCRPQGDLAGSGGAERRLESTGSPGFEARRGVAG